VAAGSGSSTYQYRFWQSGNGGSSWSIVRDWSSTATYTLGAATPVGTYLITAEVRVNPAGGRDAVSASVPFELRILPATAVGVTADLTSPQLQGTAVAFTAAGSGTTAPMSYRFWRSANGGASWSIVRDWSTAQTWTMPASTATGSYLVSAEVRTGASAGRDAVSPNVPFLIQ
jgi:hypothetical protein